MKRWRRPAPWLLLALSLAAGAQAPLRPVHPDETAEYTLNQRFSLENALACLQAVRAYLESFRSLTEAAKGRIAAAAWGAIGNTDWETQALGFANRPAAIEGALRRQNLLLKKALYDLAVAQAQPRKAEAARREWQQAEKEFRAFWETMAIAD